jgi:hypothetical protein
MSLLEKFKSGLASNLEKKEVENAYLLRKHNENLAKISEKDESGD